MKHQPTAASWRWGAGLALCLLALSVATGARGQQKPPEATTGARAGGSVGDYLVGPGDQISISVFAVPQLTQTVRVSNSGKIHVARVGILNVYRMTARQIESELSSLLQSKGLVNEPWVQVRVVQFRSSTVYVLGEVIQPGQYAITSRMSVLDLISLSEGLTPYADPTAFLYRLPAAADTPTGEPVSFRPDDVVTVDIVALTQGKKLELNMELRGGDVLYVRRTNPKYYYVVGDVTRPGIFDLTAAYENREAGSPLLLSQALARAGGPTRTAKGSKCLLVRSLPDGNLQQKPFDFDAVLRGRQPDVQVEVNDIIFVPGSNAKTVAYGLLGMLPNLAVAGSSTAMR